MPAGGWVPYNEIYLNPWVLDHVRALECSRLLRGNRGILQCFFFTDLLLVWTCSVLFHQWSSPSIRIMGLTPQGSTQGLLLDERCVAFTVDWG